jgi:hypothetical protein
MTEFTHLFQPLRIRGCTLKNRIMSTGHDTTLPVDGTVNAALVAYQEARARGGVGLIVLQVSGVHETARYTNHVLMATDDASIPDTAASPRRCIGTAPCCSRSYFTRAVKWPKRTAGCSTWPTRPPRFRTSAFTSCRVR